MKQFSLLGLVMLIGLFLSNETIAQKSAKKYPSLFWEISGNDLKKPSYLFGTMHVSSKMVFNLSDSFYQALKSVDAVALELNPEKWQGDMFRMQNAQTNLARFTGAELSDYINEQSFQLTKYEDNLKRAISEEPTVVNSLLYRSYQSRADFEENTYLDLYIYQTGRKMGKAAAGVEDYEQTEKLMLEAYQDMAREKNRRPVNTDGESMFDISRKMQDAYRKGDLDLMDSLEQMTVTSPAFSEKFLYKRNEIQANSIDTILQKRSLFVGVGAAHLPGERGVIELLRQKGYKLRPIFMQDRDASQKEVVDKMRVPVTFRPVRISDGFIKLSVPGTLYKREEARANESLQYADMNNGSYYMVTRVRTRAAMLGDNEKHVLRKIDSMLYENIPGKILKKTAISNNGFPGYDITNRTRRGDLQRYNIFVTPFEVLVFKMSGNDNYIDGKEAETFFTSIEFSNNNVASWAKYEPSHGGFSVSLPQTPLITFNKKTTDRIPRWEYEAVDEKTGDAYMIWKKSVHNYSFIEEDTFDLILIDESFRKSELIDKLLSKKFGNMNGVPFVDLRYALKNGQYVKARAYIKGPHYYFIAARSSNKTNEFSQFFNSFKLTDFTYTAAQSFTDTILNIEVKTAVYPDIDMSLREVMNKATNEDLYAGRDVSYDYWPKNKNGLFKSDSTGEAVWVSVESFPKYYFSSDSVKFWKDRLDEKKLSKDMVVKTKTFFKPGNTLGGYKIALVDTNSSRQINMHFVLKDNALFKFVTLTDTSSSQSAFINQFVASFKPLDKKLGPSVFDDKLEEFFADYYSADSTANKKARAAINNVYFGKGGATKLIEAINALNYGDKDYFELKSKLINELGYISDTCCVKNVLSSLRKLYHQTSDTSYFQNAIINSLARLKTTESFSLLKEILIQDPPVFDNTYEYGRLFTTFSDSLALAKTLFPEVLQLAQIDDYKLRLNGLLRRLVDSGYIKAADYQSYFSKLYFDAKVQLKKQQIKDEKILEKAIRQDDEERLVGRGFQQATGSTGLNDYAVLLMPFYDKNVSVQSFFNRLLQSKDADVQLNALILMVRNNKTVGDSIFHHLASRDQYRAKLLAQLEKVQRSDLFPTKYKKQEDVARSLLMGDKTYEKIADVELVKKKYMEVKDQKGYVYFFKYKVKKDDEWQMGISGLQPLDAKDVTSKDDLVRMTERRLKNDESIDEQFETQLKRMVFAKHKSSRQFYSNANYRSLLNGFSSDED